jgi:FtsZ-interacting cell division protein ZipA
VVVAIVIVAVVALLVVVMKWADRRDRAKGHVNRGMGEIRAAVRETRANTRSLRRPGSYGAVSPHEHSNRHDRFRRR